ncbi:hypothetical protein [Peribacillus sp. TH27]|nr:hypothetical protein [Peribacillus sp. TH27]MBK5458154.1 hypothetical protein [Peribacillus sp. TH27]
MLEGKYLQTPTKGSIFMFIDYYKDQLFLPSDLEELVPENHILHGKPMVEME